jgi:hypothetical protein
MRWATRPKFDSREQREEGQAHTFERKIKPLVGVPQELSIIDVMCFGPPLKPSYKRWKKRLDQILNWEKFDPTNYLTEKQIEETRHKVMYRDETQVD